MVPPGHATHNASPLVLIVFGLLFAALGGIRVYSRIVANRRRLNSLLKDSLDESPLERLKAAEPIGVGFMIIGIFIVGVGIVHAVN